MYLANSLNQYALIMDVITSFQLTVWRAMVANVSIPQIRLGISLRILILLFVSPLMLLSIFA